MHTVKMRVTNSRNHLAAGLRSRIVTTAVRPLVVAAILMGVAPGVARADFLGLAPGDYEVLLYGSSALCAGTDCLGTVHIPDASSKTDPFDWLFEIGGQVFDWTDPGLGTDVSPNGLNSCAIEGPAGAICAVSDSGVPPSLNEPPFLVLFAVGGLSTYTVLLGDEVFARGTFEATQDASSVPEPSTALLLVSAATVWVRLRRSAARHA